MSRIDKLTIKGVRSFGHTHAEAIHFNTPLTLIVGFNGSGKTTIIESLRFATTGELPPNSKGGAFVHDPSLTGEKEATAQVKLSFQTTLRGETAVVTRNVSLTIKKSTRSQSTRNPTISLRNAHGERDAMDLKATQVNELVVQKLGVSAAVLDTVIFCHQDDSLWPMSEPSALKKKFDEIFEAQQYTSAINAIKTIRKEQGDMLSRYKNDEAVYRASKEKGEKNERNRKKLEKEIEEERTKYTELTALMDELASQVKEMHDQANKFSTITEKLQMKRSQYKFQKEAANDLRGRIEELKETDEELKRSLDEYDQRLTRIAEEREQKTVQYKEVQTAIGTARTEHTKKAAEKGKHQSDKDHYEKQMTNRKDMIRVAAQTHGMRGFEGSLDDRLVQVFNDRIKKILTDRREELERVRRDDAREIDKVSQKISELEGKKKSLFQDRSSAKLRVKKLEEQLTAAQQQILGLEVDEGEEVTLKSKMKDLQASLEQAKTTERETDLDGQIRQENERLRVLEAESEALGRELVECTRLAADRAQLDLRKKELDERKSGLDSVVTTWRARFGSMLGTHWGPETVESDYQTILKHQSSQVAKVQKQKDSRDAESRQLDYKLQTAKDRRKKMAQEQDGCKKAVGKALEDARDPDTKHIPVDDFEKTLAESEESVKSLSEEISLFDEMKKFWEKVKKVANESNKCSTCDRSFVERDQAAKNKVMARVARALSDEGKAETLAEKAYEEKLLATLRGVRSKFDVWKRLGQEIPPLDEEIKSLERQKGDLEAQLEDDDQALREANEKLQNIKAIEKTANKMAQFVRDIQESEQKIERIASQQSSTAMTRSVDEINELQANKGEEVRTVRLRVDKLQADRQRIRDSIRSLELDISDMRNKMSILAGQLSRKKTLQEQVSQKREAVDTEQKAIQQASRGLEDVDPRIEELKRTRDEMTEAASAKEQELTVGRDRVASTINELKMVDRDIQDYVDNGGASKLESNLRAMATLEQRMASLEREQVELTGQINALREKQDKSDKVRQNIGENLRYRKLGRDLRDLRVEMDELEAQNAHADYERYSTQARSLELERNKHTAARERASGVIATKAQAVTLLEEEFDQDYAHAKEQYREAHVKVQTTMMAIADLGDYMVALDKAIMQYHTLKMEEINHMVADIWQSTYRGTDIDTIMIRSDAEGAATASRRQYNYRVCMLKGEVEMDMRGRCSAGQKVLASIIIRLALAESFGHSCGLIALDEPTTNLDSDNIRSLAESLHGIIQLRKEQANLQLIVITHDEEFLRAMQCGDFCDNFWRVRRNANQDSEIVRESITKLMG